MSASTSRKSKVHAGMAVTGLAAGIALLYYGREFLITVVISVILAFMLEPFVGLFMRLRLPRKLASLVVCTIAIFVVYLIALALFAQLASFADDLPAYSQKINAMVDHVAERLERTEQNAYRLLVPRRYQATDPPPAEPQTSPRKKRREPPPAPVVQEVRIREERTPLMTWVAGYVTSMYHTLLMVSFVPFLVYFMLSWRDHIHKTLLAIPGEQERRQTGRSLQAIATIARAYVVGNVILGVIISIVTCVVFWSWHLPYWILIGFISGFLSLVPYVGLALAVIPAIIGALIVYNTVTPFLLIAGEIALLHLLALNLLYPAVVGARVHLNPLAVTIALMFWGSIWGGVGLVLAIPITAAIKAVLDNREDLQLYGRLLGD